MATSTRRLPLVQPKPSDGIGEVIAESTSHDLIIAVVGHAGAGAGRVGQAIREGLQGKGYHVELVKVSDLIGDCAKHMDSQRWSQIDSKQRHERTVALQDAGDWLRHTYFPSFTAGLAIKRIRDVRVGRDSETPIAFLVDSLKNPDEVDAFRKVYGRSFYLVGVVCGFDVRQVRLRDKFKLAPPELISKLMARDEAEEAKTGQQVRATVHGADFFVNNHSPRPGSESDPVEEALARFIQIVTRSEVVRPTRDERGLYAAWGASLRSSCLSRQVGAAILDEHGELIATGTNDVPRKGGGLYEDNPSSDQDHRCFAYAMPDEGEPVGFCRNDKAKREILTTLIDKLRGEGLLAKSVDVERATEVLKKTPVADLIEFSRAVHAEMDAIISLARTGSGGARRSTLYCTTYPCHSCARHIVAAGIQEVVYYEPYTKSRAIQLHGDSIVEEAVSSGPVSDRVRFRLFTGVAPRRFAALFEKRHELKRDGRVSFPESEAIHSDPIFTKSHLQFEEVIAKKVEEQTQGTP
jgi:deoxycytidylate deaminase